MDYRSIIEGSVASDMMSLRTFIADAMEEVSRYVADENLKFDIRLIIDELLVNGADHGNAWDSSKKVHLRIDFLPNGLRIMVRDEGLGVDYHPDVYDCTSTSCSGRGLFLVESICKLVQYRGNTIHCYLGRS